MPNPCRVYHWLLRLYPARFREEFAGPLERQFLDEYREARGACERAVLLLRALSDVAATVPAEVCREFRQDLRYAMRVYRGRAVVTMLALAALALAIGATTGVFSVVNALLLRSLPFHDAERLVLEQQVVPGFDLDLASLNAWVRNSPYLEDATIYRAAEMNLATKAGTVRVPVAETTARFFTVLGTDPPLGRAFSGDEGIAGRDQVAVIAHGLWQQLFGGDQRVLGAAIRINGVPLTVIGVAPPGFDFPNKAAVWVPTAFDRDRIPESGIRSSYTVARLKSGVTIALANRITYTELKRAFPQGVDDRDRKRWASLRDTLAGPRHQASFVLLAVVTLVLLIACANVAQLLLSRSIERRAELVIRGALGASRVRLAQQLITESLVLTCAAAAGGLLVARWAAKLADSIQPPAIATQQYGLLDWPVLAFAAGLALTTGMIFGVLPAVLVAGAQPGIESIRAQHLPGAGVRRMRAMLLGLQTALAIVLVAGAVSMGRGFLKLTGADLGFRTPNVATLSVHLEGTREEPDERAGQYYRQALDRLRFVQGVESAGAVDYLPLAVKSYYISHPTMDTGVPVWAVPMTITPGYFSAIGATVIAGRDFTDADSAGSEHAAIVDDEFVKAAGLGSAIVGHRMSSTFAPPYDKPFTVVGVVRSMRLSPASEKQAQIYFASAQVPSGYATFVARVRGNPEAYLPKLRAVVSGVDPEVPVYDLKTLDQRLRDALAKPRFYTTAIFFFSGFALLLAIIGAHSVAAYSIAQRTKEIGVRIALGAYPQRLRASLFRQGMTPIAAGMLAGIAGAAASGRILQHLIATIEPTGIAMCIVASLVLASAAAFSIWAATGRIVRLDPNAALRAE